MTGDLQYYMKVGIFHHMAFPEVETGEGPVLETLSHIVDDDFFQSVEVTRPKDPRVRREMGRMLMASGLSVDFDAGGAVILAGRRNPNSLDRVERTRTVEAVRAVIGEAREIGASRLCLVTGPDPGDANRPEALRCLVESIQSICETAAEHELAVVLDLVDRDVQRMRLIGPAVDAVKVARAVREDFPSFGLSISLAHLPQLHTTSAECLELAGSYTTNTHVGNCVLRDRSSPLYGDSHPRVGYPGGEICIPELADFLRRLLDIGYVKPGGDNVVAFAVKPMDGEDPLTVIAAGKRALRQAWASIER